MISATWALAQPGKAAMVRDMSARVALSAGDPQHRAGPSRQWRGVSPRRPEQPVHPLAFRVIKDAGVRISVDGTGRWLDNIMIERLWRSLK